MLERPELSQLKRLGFSLENPYEAVEEFERSIAKFCGAPFGVAVDCVTHAMELSLRYLNAEGEVFTPKHTYPSVPMMVLKLGCDLRWKEEEWNGAYRLDPWPVIDSSLRLGPGIYEPGTFTCLSFQQKKRIGIGRGGMILVDDERAYRWLKKACHDGRNPGVKWHEDEIDMMGWHYYMTPEDAARGLLLFSALNGPFLDGGGWRSYPDLTKFEFFRSRVPQD